jgi:hypothetical protein
MKTRIAWGMTALLVMLVAMLAWWLKVGRAPDVRIAGTESALPRAAPESESVLPAALAAAREEAVRRDVRTLLVHRRGHRVFEYFAAGDGSRQVDGGELAAAVLMLAVPDPAREEPVDAVGTAALVSERLWVPLRAADAWLTGSAAVSSRCCIKASLDDWMRVGDLLLGMGAYLGERFVSTDAVRPLLADRQAPWQGEEPLAAGDGTAFDLAPGIRLWLAPRRNLAVLVWADAPVASDTTIPNIILRGLDDQAPAIGGDISDIVPGH